MLIHLQINLLLRGVSVAHVSKKKEKKKLIVRLCKILSISVHQHTTVIIYIYIKVESQKETLSIPMNYSHL